MYRVIVATLILVCCNSVIADISLTEYNKCKAISDSLKRLVCYDELEKTGIVTKKEIISTPVQPSASVAAPSQTMTTPVAARPSSNHQAIGVGAWQVKVDKNQADLSKSKATARLLANASMPSSLTPELIVHCNSKNTRLSIDWGTKVGKASRYNINIGTEKFPTPRWTTSKNKERTFYPRKVIGMMRKMFEADNYSVEIELKDGSNLKAEFDIRGIVEAVEPIRYACDW